MSSLVLEGNSLNPDTYLELWTFDASMVTATTGLGTGPIFYITNTPIGNSTLRWMGNTYQQFPFEVTNIDNKGDGTAPSRPSLVVSNIQKTILAALLTLGDLVGTNVTRYRTYYKFTDTGTEPNTTMHYPIDKYIITRKVTYNKFAVEFEMSNILDRPGLKLPRKQILRDVGFPGVSAVRARA